MARSVLDITAFSKTLNVSDPDHKEQLQYIDISLLDEDPGNRKIKDIPELAASIQLVGLQQPVRVRPGDEGRYILVSGHRRRAALQLLVDDGHEQYRSVPCLVEADAASAAMRRLRLIFGNSDTQELTSAERCELAAEVEMLLYQLKEEGYEFPGRMRDQVAAACKASSTKVAMWKVIRENLIDEYQGLYQKDKITETAAYALARMPEDFQRRVYAAVKDKAVARYTEEVYQAIQDGKYDYTACMECPDGKTCTHALAFLRHDLLVYPSERCGGVKCCMECHQATRDWSPCSNMCSKAKDARQKKAAAKKAAAKKAKDEKEAAKAQTRREKANSVVAQRYLKAIEAAGLGDNEKLNSGYSYMTTKVSDIREMAKGIFREGMSLYSDDNITPTGTGDLKRVAKQLHCSTDYLLGLTDELNSAPPQPDEPADAPQASCPLVWYPSSVRPELGEDIVVVDSFGCADNVTYRGEDWMDYGIRWSDVAFWTSAPSEATAVSEKLPLPECQLMICGWMPGGTTPREPCSCAVLVDMGDKALKKSFYRWSGECWMFETMDVRVEMEPVAWMALPEYERSKDDAED